MIIDVKKVQILVTVPEDYAQEIRDAICSAGAGIMGNYTYCSMTMKCTGRFKPSNDANPFIGKANKCEVVNEERIEVICDINIVKNVIKRIREVHPYEEPGIDIIPLISEEDL